MDDATHTDPPADGAGAVAYDLDLESGVFNWSDSLYQVFGYDRAEPANNIEWWSRHIHPNDAMGINEVMDMLMYPWVKEWTLSYRFQRADNSYALINDRATILRDKDGKALRLRGLIW